MHKHCWVMRNKLWKDKSDSSKSTEICITPKHPLVIPVMEETLNIVGDLLVRLVREQPEEQALVTLRYLDSRLLVDKEERNVGHANEGPFLVGPEHNYGSSLRGLGCNVKVSEAHAAQVWSQTNEDVPGRGRAFVWSRRNGSSINIWQKKTTTGKQVA